MAVLYAGYRIQTVGHTDHRNDLGVNTAAEQFFIKQAILRCCASSSALDCPILNRTDQLKNVGSLGLTEKAFRAGNRYRDCVAGVIR